MQMTKRGPGAVLIRALLASAATAILYHISIIGLTKIVGPLGVCTTIAFCVLVAIAALPSLISIPVSFFLAIILLVTSATKSAFELFCTLSTCLVSTANVYSGYCIAAGFPALRSARFHDSRPPQSNTTISLTDPRAQKEPSLA